MVMGNASSREDGKGPSGEKRDEDEEPMEYAPGGAHLSQHTQGAYTDPMVHFPPHSPRAYQPPVMFTSQVFMAPSKRPSEVKQAHNQILMQGTVSHEDVLSEKCRATMLTWSHGGKQVAISGSWDNWETIEPMQSLDKDFIIVKTLPSGVYHYRFIVDEQLRYAPELLWECDDLGSAYNILDLQDYVPETPQCLAEFQSPPSPVTSYDNQSLHDSDFGKAPPDLPPQLQVTLLNEPSSSAIGQPVSLPRPHHTALDHLYIQKIDDCQPVALGLTSRFLQKYVTVVLYRPSRSLTVALAHLKICW